MSDDAPVEGKVWAGTAGAGAGLTVSTFLIWLLGGLVWGAPMDASHATEAAAAVPVPVIGVVMLGITVGSAFAAGYRARHTARLVDNAASGLTAAAATAPVRIMIDGKEVGTTGAPYMGGGKTSADDTPATSAPADPAPAIPAPTYEDPTATAPGASA